MRAVDYLKALGVAVATLAITLAAGFPMVAFYAYFIEPGHPQEFYNEAAQWIAPWSSHILGPLAFSRSITGLRADRPSEIRCSLLLRQSCSMS
jgi:hypothetical protein